MIGSNKMMFNEATMRVIVQHYFETVMFRSGECPDVQAVKMLSNVDHVFEVRVKDKIEPTP